MSCIKNPHRRASDSPSIHFEAALWNQGFQAVAGMDEAGRGALAGPVVAAAVIFPADINPAASLAGVRDSKQMQPAARLEWVVRIKAYALSWGVGFASNLEIDRYGIVPATRTAFQRALGSLHMLPQYLLLDFIRLPEVALSQTSLVKGDQRSLSIAAASILAKTARDEYLFLLDRCYPDYGFARHKGYGTTAHISALHDLGPCPYHRTTFAPLCLKGSDSSCPK